MKYQDVKWLIDHGEKIIDMFQDIQPYGETIDYYHPSTANWSYILKIVKLNGELYEVLTQFGTVVGGRHLILQDNKDYRS